MHTAGGGIHPKYILPITLDVGCNTQSIQEDPFYVGLQQVLTSSHHPMISAPAVSLSFALLLWLCDLVSITTCGI